MSDLIERLRNVTEEDAYAAPWTFGLTCREAATSLAEAAATIARLEAAQAEVVAYVNECQPGSITDGGWLHASLGKIRRIFEGAALPRPHDAATGGEATSPPIP